MDRLSHRQEVHLDVCSYCRDCLVTLVLTKSAEDRSRFDALLDSWGPGGEIILQKATVLVAGIQARSVTLCSPRPTQTRSKGRLIHNEATNGEDTRASNRRGGRCSPTMVNRSRRWEWRDFSAKVVDLYPYRCRACHHASIGRDARIHNAV